MELWRRVGIVGPIATHAEGYAAMLAARGYSERTVDESVRLTAQLSRWMAEQGRGTGDFGPALLEEFLAARRMSGRRARTQLAYAPLADYLGQIGAVAVLEPPGPGWTVEAELLGSYERYLVRERGQVPATARRYAKWAAQFLSRRIEAGREDVDSLTPREITECVVAECSGRKPASARDWLGQFRSLLRFLEIDGRTQTGLLPGIPRPPGWKGESLPKALPPEQVDLLLSSCDQSAPVGLRDFAILKLLIRLGLRALEVSNLKLEDIDWRHGEITVQAKGRCERLPLPVDVGEALSAYLHGRPRVACRKAFLTVLAPTVGISSSGVSCVVRRACRRADLALLGPHRLRHNAATTMLKAGASLSEVGQVLRHQALLTTAIYAKVDRVSLRTLAQLWPGTVR